jgi:hypothetical protein
MFATRFPGAARVCALGLLALSYAPVLSASEVVGLGPDFQVGAHSVLSFLYPDVAMDDEGRFVVVWSDNAFTTNRIWRRRYDASGAALDAQEQPVDTRETSELEGPARVAVTGEGDFVVVWQHGTEFLAVGAVDEIVARRFDAAGTPIDAAEFAVGSHTTSRQWTPAVASSGHDDFVVVWKAADPLAGRIFGRRFVGGTPIGPEFRVSATTAFETYPDVASAGGRFVVVWHVQTYGDFDVFGRLFDATGAPVGPEFPVNSYTTGHQQRAAVAMQPDGGFLVVWDSPIPDGTHDVFARRFDPSGAPAGEEFRVNAYTPDNQGQADVAADPAGGFVVVWATGPRSAGGPAQDGDGVGLFGRRVDASGAPQGPEFIVNTTTTGHQNLAAVAAGPDGRFVVAWQSSIRRDDGNAAQEIFGRVFAPDRVFADGFEGGGLAAWSSSAGGGDLVVSPRAAMRGTSLGLEANVNDRQGLYVQDDTPRDERSYRARFYFNPGDFDPGETADHFRVRLFVGFADDPQRRIFAVVLRRRAGAYAVMARARLDGGTQVNTPFAPISAAPHAVELAWTAASDPESADGNVELWIDGLPAGSAVALDNAEAALDFVRLGAIGVKAGASGTMYWDEFESRRASAIGP